MDVKFVIYKNIILTKHAERRMKSRYITADAVYKTINYPDKKQAKNATLTKFIKIIRQRKYHVIAEYKKPANKYLVISTWVRGEKDRKPLIWTMAKFLVKVLKKIL